MKIINTEIEGVYIIENFHAKDNRGSFTKTFHRDFFKQNNLCSEFCESYFSVNNKNVIRGMHFQLPPDDHEKLVYVPKGKILDVILDIGKKSRTYGNQYLLNYLEKIIGLFISQKVVHMDLNP